MRKCLTSTTASSPSSFSSNQVQKQGISGLIHCFHPRKGSYETRAERIRSQPDLRTRSVVDQVPECYVFPKSNKTPQRSSFFLAISCPVVKTARNQITSIPVTYSSTTSETRGTRAKPTYITMLRKTLFYF